MTTTIAEDRAALVAKTPCGGIPDDRVLELGQIAVDQWEMARIDPDYLGGIADRGDLLSKRCTQLMAILRRERWQWAAMQGTH